MLRLKRYPKRSPYWYVRGTVRGQRIDESTSTTDKAQAEAYRVKIERELWERGALGREPPAGFGRAVNAYLDSRGEARFIGPLLDYFAAKPISEIGQAEIDACARALYPDRKASTLNRQVYGPMIAILRHAADAGLPGASLKRIKMPKVQKVVAKWGTDETVSAILPHCSPGLRALVLVMTYTGLRISEVLRLTPMDFQLRPGSVMIGRTKNGEPAMVPIPPQATEALQAAGWSFEYTTREGVNKALKRAARLAGVPYLTSHQIGRHTFAARLLSAGYDLKTVKEAGRWKKLQIVDEIYGHLEIGQAHAAMLDVANKERKRG